MLNSLLQTEALSKHVRVYFQTGKKDETAYRIEKHVGSVGSNKSLLQ